jgi:hypothetical protein
MIMVNISTGTIPAGQVTVYDQRYGSIYTHATFPLCKAILDSPAMFPSREAKGPLAIFLRFEGD